MNNQCSDIHERFLRAFEAANSMGDIDIPIDLRLRFYAFYKQATIHTLNSYTPKDPVEIRNAFKINALLQVKGLSQDDAKLAYIELVNDTIKKYKLNIKLI